MAEPSIPPRPDAFLGIGWSFPPRFAHGEVAMSADADDVAESLRILFGTSAGERLFHPAYGLNPRELMFEPVSTTLRTLLKDQVRVAILIHEPRIRLIDVRIDSPEPGSGTLAVELEYELRSTNSRYNLVFPFYRSDGNELRDTMAPPQG